LFEFNLQVTSYLDQAIETDQESR